MYRLLIIVQCVLSSVVLADVNFLDGFFNKPINESTDVFRNPRLYPYRYRNVDDQLERSKRFVSDTVYWDRPNSCKSEWFSATDRDYYLVAKSVLIVFACIACLGIFVLCVYSCTEYCTKHCCEECNMNYEDKESEKLIKCP